MEYAGDLNVSDDEATLEEEEVNSNSLGTVQAFSQLGSAAWNASRVGNEAVQTGTVGHCSRCGLCIWQSLMVVQQHYKCIDW